MSVFGVVKMRSVVLMMIAVLLVAVLCGGIGAGVAVAASKSARLLPVYCVEDERQIAITFDASWGAERTKGIVDELCRNGIQATFFLTGIWIDAYPEQTAYIAAHGMEIGNHSHHHYNMGDMDKDCILAEINYVNHRVMQLTGQTPKVFRAPFGDYGNTLITTLAELDMRCVQWNVDSLDWQGLAADVLTSRVDKATAGSIILCHNNSDHILEALPQIIENMTAKGYTFVTVSALLAGKTGTIDHTGKLHA